MQDFAAKHVAEARCMSRCMSVFVNCQVKGSSTGPNAEADYRAAYTGDLDSDEVFCLLLSSFAFILELETRRAGDQQRE